MTLCARRNASKDQRTGKKRPPDECRLGLYMLGTGLNHQQVFDYYNGWMRVLKPQVWRHITKCTVTNKHDCPLARYVPMAEKRAN